MKKEKQYYFIIKVEWGCNITAISEKMAREKIKDIYAEEHNLELIDEEIILDK